MEGHFFSPLPTIAFHVVVSLTFLLMKWLLAEHCALNPSIAMALAWFVSCLFSFHLFSHQCCLNICYTLPLWVWQWILTLLSFPFLSRSSYSICVDISRQNHKFDWCIRRIFFYSRPTFSGQMKISGDKNSGIRSTFFCMCVRSCFAWVLALCIINNISDANTWNHNRKRICCSSMLEQASPSLITCYPLILITLPFSLLSRLSISFPSQSVPTAQAEFLLMLMDNLSLDSAIEIWRAHWWRETFPWLLPAWLTTNWYFRCPELWPTLLCITQKERIRHFWSWYTTMISCGSKEEMLS